MPPKKGNQASAHALRARAYYRNLPPAELRKAKFPDLEKDAGLNEPLLGCMQPEDALPCDNYVPCAFLDMTGGNIESAADHGYAVTLGMKMPKAPSYRLPNGTFCDFETGRVWIAAGKQVQKGVGGGPSSALRAGKAVPLAQRHPIPLPGLPSKRKDSERCRWRWTLGPR